MKYFKVHRGFGENDFIPIDETELKKAIYAQITGKVVILNNGTIGGNMIQAIMPDYNRAMGYNNGYKLQPEDWEEINARHKDYQGAVAQVKSEVLQAIEGGNVKLLEN